MKSYPFFYNHSFSLRFFVSLIQREDFWYIFFFVKNLKNWNGG